MTEERFMEILEGANIFLVVVIAIVFVTLALMSRKSRAELNAGDPVTPTQPPVGGGEISEEDPRGVQ